MRERWTPSKDRPYFVYDPQCYGFSYFETEQERDDFANNCIQAYLEDSWDEEVEQVVAGTLTHRATQTDVIMRPYILDEDGCDEEGNDWNNDFSSIFDYKLLPLES